MRLLRLALLALAACATAGVVPAPEAPPRAAELARVRCLLVAPLENVSDVGQAADAAAGAVQASIDPDRTRVYPVKELRALFRDTPLELPEGFPASLALELADILGADAALYGTVEGRWRGAGHRLIVTLRLSLAGSRDLLLAETVEVVAAQGEPPEESVRRSVAAAAGPVLVHLGSPSASRECHDPARLARLRAMATGQAARTPPPPRPEPPPPAGDAPSPAAAEVPSAVAPPAGAAAAARAPKAAPPRNPRQVDWARRLAARERFVVEGVAFQGRTAQLGRSPGLADLAGALAAAPEIDVRLEAFVDATPDPDKDAQLSRQMAQAAGQKLVELGVARGRISWAGRAGERPILPNFTAKGRAANRRLEAVGLR
ncbi:MAG TPA: OmpA family protein [Anaeromyxobacteraceae bacterium]|nr:OmpA family protein [Anaeromyxobacteraceae bacterium]